ncbi:MAG: SipW-dependent-type signal peptide-containing protein [Tenericutes bacterium]|jgi:predicted ribosomally synthesized peptide with SipW-like signal peptide|nr:SipW-dependent-type signal peptide-containing protein [Mycoplasmatota bacterium]
MNRKRNILRIAIFVFMAISLSLTTGQTLAYWSDVTDVSELTTTAVATGTWQQVFPWDINATYAIGDLVTYNGITYQSQRDNNIGNEPGTQGTSRWASV